MFFSLLLSSLKSSWPSEANDGQLLWLLFIRPMILRNQTCSPSAGRRKIAFAKASRRGTPPHQQSHDPHRGHCRDHTESKGARETEQFSIPLRDFLPLIQCCAMFILLRQPQREALPLLTLLPLRRGTKQRIVSILELRRH
ncbi:hypothetical protein BJX66DRAFT_320685 [Aspergillus keveii]|uniref:Secreted protein n=1 Tax=Aspergillus keveii TaxID=714993 RepID=A0ABR4FGT5_9EURO